MAEKDFTTNDPEMGKVIEFPRPQRDALPDADEIARQLIEAGWEQCAGFFVETFLFLKSEIEAGGELLSEVLDRLATLEALMFVNYIWLAKLRGVNLNKESLAKMLNYEDPEHIEEGIIEKALESFF
jgi:hypothetical protein